MCRVYPKTLLKNGIDSMVAHPATRRLPITKSSMITSKRNMIEFERSRKKSSREPGASPISDPLPNVGLTKKSSVSSWTTSHHEAIQECRLHHVAGRSFTIKDYIPYEPCLLFAFSTWISVRVLVGKPEEIRRCVFVIDHRELRVPELIKTL